MIDDDRQMIDTTWLCCVLDWDAGRVPPGCPMLQEISTQCQVAPTGKFRAVSQGPVSSCLWLVPPGVGAVGGGLFPCPPPACHPAQKNSSLSKGPGSVFVDAPCTSPLSQDGSHAPSGARL